MIGEKVRISHQTSLKDTLQLNLDHPNQYHSRKQLLDRTASVALLGLSLPVIGILALVVKGSSRGPAFFRQVRLGRDGLPYTMYKLRTMRSDAEAATGPVWTQCGDKRVTFAGKLLRKFHLDELPQLWNVTKGEMSLIGPRPERPEFAKVLTKAIPEFPRRLSVLPGITGLAQVNLPPDSDLASVKRKLALDSEYIETACLWLDARIALATALRFFALPGPTMVRYLGVERIIDDDQIGIEQSQLATTPQQLAACLVEEMRNPVPSFVRHPVSRQPKRKKLKRLALSSRG